MKKISIIIAAVLAFWSSEAFAQGAPGTQAVDWSTSSQAHTDLTSGVGTPGSAAASTNIQMGVKDAAGNNQSVTTYSVRIDGNWVKLDASQIITEPNRIGVAVVWIWMGKVTCFIPGAGG